LSAELTKNALSFLVIFPTGKGYANIKIRR